MVNVLENRFRQSRFLILEPREETLDRLQPRRDNIRAVNGRGKTVLNKVCISLLSNPTPTGSAAIRATAFALDALRFGILSRLLSEAWSRRVVV